MQKMDKKTTEFYERLKEELNSTTKKWPSEYLYKFIVPSDIEKIAQVEGAFNRMGAIIDTRQSKNGKFTSISISVHLNSADEVIQKYQEVSTIEGIISL